MENLPFQDHHAAIAWLANPTNSSFDTYSNLTADSTRDWAWLQEQIERVTGQPQFIAEMKKIFDKHMDPAARRQHMTVAAQELIAEDAFQVIIASSTKSWKEESRDWVRRAVRVIIPRVNGLWKKGIRKQALSVHSSEDPKPRSKTPQPRPSESPTKAPTKRPAAQDPEVEHHNIKRVQVARDVGHVRSSIPTQTPLLLVDRTIEVEWRGLEPAADTRLIKVGISAIIADDHLTRPDEDIRAHHLDYVKFRHILTGQEPAINFDACEYEWSTPSQDGIGATEKEFRFFVGLMIKDLERAQSGRDVKIILKTSREL